MPKTKFTFFAGILSQAAQKEINRWIGSLTYEKYVRPPTLKISIDGGRLVEEYFTRLEVKPGVNENEQRLELALELARKFSRGGVIIFGDRRFVDFAREHLPLQIKNFHEVPVATRKWLTIQVG